VRSTPELDARLRKRLQEAVDRFAEGSADAFGRLIGYANGGYIRQSLRADDPRPVRSSLIARINDVPLMRGWFDSLLPPLVASDVRREDSQPAQPLRSSAHAHEVLSSSFMLPVSITWELLMQTDDLPERFVVEVPDDALAPNLPRGTAVVFERASLPQPGECVLVQDSRGARYMRRYVQGVGGAFTAQALNDAYVTLGSGRDGLKVLAVMAWRAERRV
jgi:hypothetical protein